MRPPLPERYVDRRLRESRERLAPEVRGAIPNPGFTWEQLVYLRSLYPPRVMREGEGVDNHLRYAGASDLVEKLVLLEDRREASAEGPPINPLDDPSAERV